MRIVVVRVTRTQMPMAIAAIPMIVTPRDAENIRTPFERITDTLAGQFPEVASMLEGVREDILTFTHFPEAHCRTV